MNNKRKGAYVKPVNVLENWLATRILGEGLFASLPCHWPVDQKQVKVVQTESVERALQRLGDIVGVVCIVPEFCCYEQLIARDAAGSNGLSDGFFGSVSIFVSGRLQPSLGYTHAWAVSIWRYPALMASLTAFSWDSASCQVPNPMAGISAPVLSLNLVRILVIVRLRLNKVESDSSCLNRLDITVICQT